MSDTTEFQSLLERLSAGDDTARGELISLAESRIRIRASKMLKKDRLRRFEQTDDVLQNALLQLHKSLKDVHPETIPKFFALAAMQIDRTLINLARHHYGPLGQGKHHHTDHKPADEKGGALDRKPSEPEDLYEWEKLHKAVKALPAEEKEVFDLIWYYGLSQAQAALVLGVSERSIGRRFRSAKCKLNDILSPRKE